MKRGLVLCLAFWTCACGIPTLGAPGTRPEAKHPDALVTSPRQTDDSGEHLGNDARLDDAFVSDDTGGDLDADALGPDRDPPPDGGYPDAEDAGVTDALGRDAAPVRDAESFDADSPDSGQEDAAPRPDALPPDADPVDGGMPAPDAVVFADASPRDAGSAEAGVADAGFTDSGSVDAGATDSGPADSGLLSCPSGYRLIQPGIFTMGTPMSAPWYSSPEGPEHSVTITRAYLMGQAEVTQGEWQAVTGSNPSWNPTCGSDCPVASVSWNMAVAFANTLSQIDGYELCYSGSPGSFVFAGPACNGWRLPTEAEWEYAARAGTTTAFWNGDPVLWSSGSPNQTAGEPLHAIGWWLANSSVTYMPCRDTFTAPDNGFRCAGPHPVRLKLPNPWNLYDTNGNVWELTGDCWSNDYGSNAPQTDPFSAGPCVNIVRRGGAFDTPQGSATVSVRYGDMAGFVNEVNGLRLARTCVGCCVP